jgi:hypothetical protein
MDKYADVECDGLGTVFWSQLGEALGLSLEVREGLRGRGGIYYHKMGSVMEYIWQSSHPNTVIRVSAALGLRPTLRGLRQESGCRSSFLRLS